MRKIAKRKFPPGSPSRQAMNLPHPIQLGACQLGQQGGIECPFSIKPIPQRRAFASNLTEDTRTGRVQAGASLAQLVEHFICNENVVGSIPTAGSIPNLDRKSTRLNSSH